MASNAACTQPPRLAQTVVQESPGFPTIQNALFRYHGDGVLDGVGGLEGVWLDENVDGGVTVGNEV